MVVQLRRQGGGVKGKPLRKEDLLIFFLMYRISFHHAQGGRGKALMARPLGFFFFYTYNTQFRYSKPNDKGARKKLYDQQKCPIRREGSTPYLLKKLFLGSRKFEKIMFQKLLLTGSGWLSFQCTLSFFFVLNLRFLIL